jgi:hypothetical protein
MMTDSDDDRADDEQCADEESGEQGFGGQFDYFGFCIDDQLERGHSKGHPRSTTFNNPCLASSSDYEIDAVEVWAVGPPKEDDGSAPTGKGSILDRDKQAQALLDMAGKTRHSEALREPPPED